MKIEQWLSHEKYCARLGSTFPPAKASKATLNLARSLPEWKDKALNIRPGNQSLHLSMPTFLANKRLETIFFGDDPRLDSAVDLQIDTAGKFKSLAIRSLGLDATDRAVLEVLSLYSSGKQISQLRLLVAEPFSALSLQIRGRFPRAITSGYMPDSPASLFPIRHVDLLEIELPDNSMDALITIEVFEHLTNYRKALAEAARVLRTGGIHIFTCPFYCSTADTTQKAILSEQGNPIFLMEPEYHGDPVRPNEGILVYQIPGWDIIKHILDSGFSDAAACYLSSPEGGIVGKHFTGVFVFVCQK